MSNVSREVLLPRNYDLSLLSDQVCKLFPLLSVDHNSLRRP